MWSALGSATRALGQAMDKLGIALEGDAAYIEKLPIPTTVVKIDGKAPSIGEASFVAPSANLIGAVQLGPGASAWYGALLKGDTKPVSVGKLSSVGEHASVGLRAKPDPDPDPSPSPNPSPNASPSPSPHPNPGGGGMLAAVPHPAAQLDVDLALRCQAP